MTGAVRSWLSSIAAVTLLLTVAQQLIPAGTLRRVADLLGGLLLLAALLQPLGEMDWDFLGLDLTSYREAIAEREAELTLGEKEALAALIAERTEAYISDKADALGVPVRVRVETSPGADGVPVPWSVRLEGPRSAELAGWLARELGVPEERQAWYEGKN